MSASSPMPSISSLPSSSAPAAARPPPCAPPRVATGRAQVPVPALACDCHAHVFGPPELYPYRSERRYTPAAVDGRDYRRMLAALGIARAVIVQPDIYRDNRVTEDALADLARAGVEARGVALIDAAANDAELERLHAAGFRGARCQLRKLRAADGAARCAAIDAVAARIAAFGWHLQLHLDGASLPELEPWLRRLPLDVVLDHLGRVQLHAGTADPGCRALLRLVGDGACWVKLSAPNRFGDPQPPYPSLTPFIHTLVQAAPERFVWGSDWPHSSSHGVMPDDAALLDLLAAWVPLDALREQVLVHNPARLYGFFPEVRRG